MCQNSKYTKDEKLNGRKDSSEERIQLNDIVSSWFQDHIINKKYKDLKQEPKADFISYSILFISVGAKYIEYWRQDLIHALNITNGRI
jgi:hypothetical protein